MYTMTRPESCWIAGTVIKTVSFLELMKYLLRALEREK